MEVGTLCALIISSTCGIAAGAAKHIAHGSETRLGKKPATTGARLCPVSPTLQIFASKSNLKKLSLAAALCVTITFGVR